MRSELNVLNAELEAVMTDEQGIEDYDSVVEYDEAAVCALALLEHNIDMLKTSSSLPATEPPTAADGNRSTEPSTITTHSQREFGARIQCTTCKRRHASTMCNPKSSAYAGSRKAPNVAVHVATNSTQHRLATEVSSRRSVPG
ncbi:hypothetical protein HPB52_006874 [Rhipicephalus sanguineus]|uniref:Uncharacterized protein n=1 Tax=Rhipicephalus sanguineus TaxID=34632 RepID=A0A9D4Q5B4_RHISA|nr:hypothetical protein HPB52_006874 [Rhipicephalus sanguineus]